VPTPWVILFRPPERATALADPQSPILAVKSPGEDSLIKILCDCNNMTHSSKIS
jgi:hypothetical protein